ncbi:HAMP domain-containing sensor histidine kinase [Rhizobium sp. Leaf262]|uniref:sensor histidine kinase n=1 Tax=Rhizobium sp. Leaf262 TaxID=1736312 RepID=UPI0007142317|nr:HAMP domain-containing sensor histidine kinase [Rhizobium sp. Leaf262]KQO75052.1 histidine kinase [Rhizobium sp. Leaf262]
MKNSTLSRKLFLRIAPVVVVAIVAIGAFAFDSATREIDNIYDAQMINDANVMWGLLRHRLEDPARQGPHKMGDIDFSMDNQLAFNEDADDYADAHMFRAWVDGHIAVYSSTAFLSDVPPRPVGFSDFSYKGEAWRIYSLRIPDTAIVLEVGQKDTLRATLVANILLNLFFPLLVILPIIAALIWLGINSSLSTIHDLVRQIRTRSPDDLSAIPTGALSRDLLPLGRSINQLLVKLGNSLTLERRFSDLAAHQLRTPQASVKLLLQMLRNADDEAERQQLISSLVESNDRASHLIEQLLRLARVSHHPLRVEKVALYHMTASVLAEFGALINSRNLDVSLEGEEDIEVETDGASVRTIIVNLIDNAVKYSVVGGRVAVVVSSDGDACLLSISDTGPGIAPEERSSVFQRFYRVDTLQTEGSGLGLAIVADIAERLSIKIDMGTPEWGAGLKVYLHIPQNV